MGRVRPPAPLNRVKGGGGSYHRLFRPRIFYAAAALLDADLNFNNIIFLPLRAQGHKQTERRYFYAVCVTYGLVIDSIFNSHNYRIMSGI